MMPCASKMFSKGHLRRSIVKLPYSKVSVSPVAVTTHTINVIIYDMDVPGVKAGANYPVIYRVNLTPSPLPVISLLPLIKANTFAFVSRRAMSITRVLLLMHGTFVALLSSHA